MRKQINLNGNWKFQTDPQNKGEVEKWYIEGLQKSMQVTVPHIWQSEGGEYVNYTGISWYMREFSLENLQTDKKMYLHFDAVDYQARIWVNGEYIGEHEGGFTPFEFDITDWICDKKTNRIVVRVYDPQDNAEIPIGKQGSWYTRVSGIWQGVYLEERPQLFAKYVFVTPNVEQKKVDVKIKFCGEYTDTDKVSYIVRPHLGDKMTLAAGVYPIDGNEMALSVDIPNVILWEPDNPHLYEIEIKIESQYGIDYDVKVFGMRNISYDNGRITLNGKPIYIRGALDQGFYPDTIYIAPSDEYIQNEIRLAKDMGFNLLRKHIKAEIPRYLYWADRMGMLIWAEPPNYVKWTAQGQQRFKNELMNMIKRDFHHPSIIIWSIYNEEWGLEWDLANDMAKQKHVEQLYDEIKQLDSTRLVCDNSGWCHVKTDINDHHRYFVCPDQIEAWREDLDKFVVGSPDANFVDTYKADGQPIIVSEFGVWGLPSVQKLKDYYNGEPWWFINQGEETHQEDFKNPLTAQVNFEKYGVSNAVKNFEDLAVSSQKRMNRAVKSLIEEMRKRPTVAGYVVTEFTDIEWETNGWLDYLRNPKEGFDSFKDFNGELVIMVDGVNHNLWCGQKQQWDLVISNTGLKSFNGIIKWHILGTTIKGEVPICINGEPYIRLKRVITFEAPQNIEAGFYVCDMTLFEGIEVLAQNTEELTISPKNQSSSIQVLPYNMSNAFRDALKSNGFQIVQNFNTAAVVVTNCLDKQVEQFARDGGKVVFLAEEGDCLQEKGQFTFRHLPEGESWDRTSSFNFVNTNWFKGIPLYPEMGWEVDMLIPNYIIPFTDYSKASGTIGRMVHMFGNEGLANSSEVISGYFQGWIGQVGASVIHQKMQQGSILLTTWRLMNTYGHHPIATQVLNCMIEKA